MHFRFVKIYGLRKILIKGLQFIQKLLYERPKFRIYVGCFFVVCFVRCQLLQVCNHQPNLFQLKFPLVLRIQNVEDSKQKQTRGGLHKQKFEYLNFVTVSGEWVFEISSMVECHNHRLQNFRSAFVMDYRLIYFCKEYTLNCFYDAHNFRMWYFLRGF